MWDEVLADAPPLVRDVVVGLGEVLEQAPVLGSLLKPEEYLREAIGERLETPRLGDEALGSFEDVEALVLDAAGRIAAEAASTPAERLFAADTSDALGFVDLMTRRYDTILMNPPFGGRRRGTKATSRVVSADPRSDGSLRLLSSSGIGRVRRSGSVGAITNRTGSSSRRLEVAVGALSPAACCRWSILGLGVMHDALVEVGCIRARATTVATAIQSSTLLRIADKAATLDAGQVATAVDVFESSGTVERFRDAVCILVDRRFGVLSSGSHPTIEGRWQSRAGHCDRRRLPVREALVGGPTARTLGATVGGRSAKGGEYSPVLSDIHLVVDWENDGQ